VASPQHAAVTFERRLREFLGVKKKQSGLAKPAAMDLAKLAAILQPGLRPTEALKVAMKFYVEAVLFLRDLPFDSEDDFIREFGSGERQVAQRVKALKQELQALREDTLELDPKKDDDEARQFLASLGFPWKQARTVLRNFLEYLNQPLPKEAYLANHPWPSADSILARCERVKDGRKVYALSKSLLEGIASYADRRRHYSRTKGHETRRKKNRQQKSSL